MLKVEKNSEQKDKKDSKKKEGIVSRKMYLGES